MANKKKADNFVDYIYTKNPSLKWEIAENNSITLLQENKGIFNTLAQKFLKKPRVSQIHMEEMGSFIWPLIDGKTSVYEIGQKVKEHFGDSAEPLYERLSVYMKQLEDYKFIIR